ncbi:monooxygenase 1-like [Panicum virgatum]|nr:monooxygenase 1-like [Panicum virgatum]
MEEEVHGIVIVGGGICGLATALALHRKGIPSLVLEKYETLRTAGGSIGVHANGWRVLEQLGIAPELRKTADLVTEFHDVWQQEQGNKSVVVPVRGELRWLKRKDLIETMAKNIPSGAIRFGCRIAEIHPANPDNHGAVLTTLDGSIIRAKALIGCDGSNSVVAKYLGLSPPRPASRMILRGLTRYPHGHPFGPHFLRLRCGGLFVGRSPVTDHLVSCVVAFWHPGADATKDARAMKALVLRKLKEQRCSDEVAGMVRDLDPESLIVLTRVWYRPPWQVMFSSFRRGTATVAGDAMHVMGSYIGQGGSAALEDALVLARSLSRAAAGGRELREEKIGAAMGAYVRERRLRVVRLSLESFAMGTMLATKSLLTKLACFAIVTVLGTNSLGHTNYDCGRL